MLIINEKLLYIKTTFLIAGTHAVVEALKNPNRKVHRIFATEDASKKINRDNQDLTFLRTFMFFIIKRTR